MKASNKSAANIRLKCRRFLSTLNRNLRARSAYAYSTRNKKLIRRWDGERELSLRRHFTRTKNTIRLLHKFRHRSFSSTQVYRIQWNNAMQRPLRRSRSFKVTDFVANWKLIYVFLLVHQLQVRRSYANSTNKQKAAKSVQLTVETVRLKNVHCKPQTEQWYSDGQYQHWHWVRSTSAKTKGLD